jgi:hypothetical protein
MFWCLGPTPGQQQLQFPSWLLLTSTTVNTVLISMLQYRNQYFHKWGRVLKFVLKVWMELFQSILYDINYHKQPPDDDTTTTNNDGQNEHDEWVILPPNI